MPSPRPPALRILFLAANPTNTEWLRLDHEAKEIERKVHDSPHRDSIVVEACWGATADDLQRILLERTPHIVHFSGHGRQGGVALEGPTLGGHALASAEALADLLRIVNRDICRVRVVVLNSCHSAAQLAALCEVVECAIGMGDAVADRVAADFSAALYQAVGAGRSMRDSFELARNRLQLDWPEFAHVPQLWARAGGAAAAGLVLLPPAGARAAAPQLDTSGRWLTGKDLKVGDALAEGRYVLQEWLGQGTFATVWRAKDSGSGRVVALKILQERYAGDTVIHDRFFRGARLMSQFRHPAIVQVLEPHLSWHGYRFFVMEYVHGRTLMEYAVEHRLGWRQVVAYGLEIGAALTYAHERSCIHRDVKPLNILVDAAGHARLFDFDLVRDMYVEGGTRAGAMGTIAYAAPEAVDRPQDTDARSDEYSLAMTLACTLVGREPSRQDKRDPAIFIHGLPCPRPVREVLRKAAALEPHDRFGSMLGFTSALRDAVARHDASVRRNRVAVPSTVLSLGGAALGYALWAGTADPPTTARAPTPTSPTSPARGLEDLPAPPATDLDARLAAALRVDRSGVQYAIRITADNTLAEARDHARAVLQTSRFEPWIVWDGRLYYVYVGAYASRDAAEADRDAAKVVRGEGARNIHIAGECPGLRLGAGGYHECT